MDEKYSALFTPWKIGNVEIPNRIVQCSMGGTSLFGWLEPCHFDKEAANFLLTRAKDGVGLVLPGMQCVRDTMGRRWLYQNKKMFKELADYMVEYHKTGSKLFIQLAAGFGRSMAVAPWMVTLNNNKLLGALARPVIDVSYCCASASATPNRWQEDMLSRPMTVEEIHEMVDAFGKTAKLLREAGVEGVEIALRENAHVRRDAAEAHFGSQLAETALGHFGTHRAADILVAEGRKVGIVEESLRAEPPVAHAHGGERCEHRADVDEHVENLEARVAQFGILFVVVKLPHERLEVAFEQTVAEGDHHQCADHHGLRRNGGNHQRGIPRRHHQNTRDDRPLIVAQPVGDQAADERQDVDRGIKKRIDFPACSPSIPNFDIRNSVRMAIMV